ncbi:OpgC domain-containing protein, partial [Burkholderia humptydooensis]
FIAIAWLAAKLVHLGWMHRIARAMPWIGTIGRQGLLCFVAGTGISLLVDSLLYTATDGYLDVRLGLVADAAAVGLLYVVAKLYAPLVARASGFVRQSRRRRPLRLPLRLPLRRPRR